MNHGKRARSSARVLLGWLVLSLLGPMQEPRAAGPQPPSLAPSVGFVDAVARGPGVEERLAEIRRRIQRAVVYPPIARRRGLTGVARVRFEVDHGGHATRVHLQRSSGHYLLDRAARRAVSEAGVLPWVYGRLEVPVRFALEHAP